MFVDLQVYRRVPCTHYDSTYKQAVIIIDDPLAILRVRWWTGAQQPGICPKCFVSWRWRCVMSSKYAKREKKKRDKDGLNVYDNRMTQRSPIPAADYWPELDGTYCTLSSFQAVSISVVDPIQNIFVV